MTNDHLTEGVWGDAVVTASDGLHARPAELIVQCASAYKATVFLHLRGQKANARSLLMIMSLGARQGDTLEIEAHGEEAPQALQALATAISNPSH